MSEGGGAYDISASLSNSATQGFQSGDFIVGGDRGLRTVLYGVLAVIALGLVLWFAKKR